MNMQKTKKKKSPIKAIREFCITCVGGRANEGHMKLVRECVSENCECLSLDWAIILTTLKTYLLNRDKIEVRD